MTREEFILLHDSIQPDENGCRRWPLSLKAKGYPQVSITGEGQLYGHRVALECKLGRPIAPGLRSLHECDNKWCFSFEHLYEGTEADNAKDRKDRNRLPKGNDHWMNKYPERIARGDRHGTRTQPDSRRNGHTVKTLGRR